MEQRKAWMITDKTEQQEVLTDARVIHYTVRVEEGEGVRITLYSLNREHIITYADRTKGFFAESRPNLHLSGLGYSITRTLGHDSPYKLVISC